MGKETNMGNETNGNGSSNGSGGAVLDEARMRAIIREELERLFLTGIDRQRVRVVAGNDDELRTMCGMLTERLYRQWSSEPEFQAVVRRIERERLAAENIARAKDIRAESQRAEEEAQSALARRDVDRKVAEGIAITCRERAAGLRASADSIERQAVESIGGVWTGS